MFVKCLVNVQRDLSEGLSLVSHQNWLFHEIPILFIILLAENLDRFCIRINTQFKCRYGKKIFKKSIHTKRKKLKICYVPSRCTVLKEGIKILAAQEFAPINPGLDST